MSWTVTRDTPDVYEFSGGGDPVVGHTISFQTGSGARGSVFVPNDHYTPANVRTLVAKAAATADEVAKLSSED